MAWGHAAAALALLAATAAPAQKPPALSPEQRVQHHHQAAEACWQKKDLPCTLKELRGALQFGPGHLPSQLLLGRAYLEGGNAKAAARALERSLQLGAQPEDVALPLAQALLLQGLHKEVLRDTRLAAAPLSPATRHAVLLLQAGAALELGDPERALPLIEQAKALQPTDATPWLLQSRAWQWRGDRPQALASVEHALALAPRSPAALVQRAALRQALGQGPAARADLDQALAIDTRHLDARVARAGLRLAAGEYDAAADDIIQLQQGHAQDARTAFLSAALLHHRGNINAATAALREVAARLDPQPAALLDRQAQLLLIGGLAHAALGDAAKATNYFERYRRAQGPGAADTLLAGLYTSMGRPERGLSLLQDPLRPAANDAQALTLSLTRLAEAQLAAGRASEATRLMQQALASRDDAEFHALLGLSLLQAGRSREAVAALTQALKKNPQQVRAARALAEEQLRSGQASAALPLAQGLAKREPAVAAHHELLGRILQAQGQPAAARKAFDTALAADPQHLPAALGLARLDIAARQPARAEERLLRLAGSRQQGADAALELAALYDAQRMAEPAQRWLERSVAAARPGDWRASVALVDFHLRQQQTAAALAAARAAADKAPSQLAPLLLLARVESAGGNPGAARQHLAAAARSAGDEAAALWLVARLQVGAGDLDGARSTLDRALQTQPALLPLQVARAELDLRSGAFGEAERRLRPLIEQQPDAAPLRSLLGQALLAQGQLDDGLQALDKAHALAPGSESLLRLYAAGAARHGPAQALPVLEQWLRSHPADVVVRNALGDGLVLAGRLPAARAQYEQVLRDNPQAHAVRNNLAHVMSLLKDPGALAMARQALAGDPGNPDIQDTVAWLAFQGGRADEALSLLRDARLRQPASPLIRYHLAAVLAHTGRPAEARAELQAALAGSQPFAGRSEAEALWRTLQDKPR